MYIAQRKENISRCSVWAAATASLLLLLLTSSSSSFADATIELSLDPPDFDVASVMQFQSNAPVSGTCPPDSAQCGEYSVARAIQNGNTAQGGYCSVGGGDTNNAAVQKNVIYCGTYGRRPIVVSRGHHGASQGIQVPSQKRSRVG